MIVQCRAWVSDKMRYEVFDVDCGEELEEFDRIMVEYEGMERAAVMLRGQLELVCPFNPRYTDGYKMEIPDPVPVEIPVGMKVPESLEDLMTRMLNNREALRASLGEVETPEEAEDFDIGDGDVVVSPLQEMTMAEDLARESKRLAPAPKSEKEGGEEDGRKDSSVGDNGSKPATSVDKSAKSGKKAAKSAAVPDSEDVEE